MAETQPGFLRRQTLKLPSGHFVVVTVKQEVSLSSLHPTSLSRADRADGEPRYANAQNIIF